MHVMPLALGFVAAYPGIHLRTVLSVRVVNLLEENLDVAIRIGALHDSSMIASLRARLARPHGARPVDDLPVRDDSADQAAGW